MNRHLNGFLEFIREQGVIGLAIGFVLGGAVTKVVAALVTDLINPIVGLLLGSDRGLRAIVWKIGDARLLIGDFLTVLIDFAIIALVVYIAVKILKFDRLDRSKDTVAKKGVDGVRDKS